MIRWAGVRAHPRQIGLSEVDLRRALVSVSDCIRSEGLFPSAVTEVPLGEPAARRIVADTLALLRGA